MTKNCKVNNKLFFFTFAEHSILIGYRFYRMLFSNYKIFLNLICYTLILNKSEILKTDRVNPFWNFKTVESYWRIR